MLPTSKLYNGIYKVLSSDPELLGLIGLATNSSLLQKAMKIQKRSKPQNLADTLPIVAFYTPGGDSDRENGEVFNSLFCFDIYTSDNPDLAQRICDRIFSLFDGSIPSFDGVDTLVGGFEDAHESSVSLPNTYCFTIKMWFSISLAD